MGRVMECNFNSVWDGESVILTSSAMIDLETGRIFEIEIADGLDDDGGEVETLDREYVDFVGIDGEFDVEEGTDGHYYAASLEEVRRAIDAVAVARPMTP